MILALLAAATALVVSADPAQQLHDQVVAVHFAPFERIRDLCPGHGPLVTSCTVLDAAGRPVMMILPTPSSWPGTDKAYRCQIEHEGDHWNGWPASHAPARDCR